MSPEVDGSLFQLLPTNSSEQHIHNFPSHRFQLIISPVAKLLAVVVVVVSAINHSIIPILSRFLANKLRPNQLSRPLTFGFHCHISRRLLGFNFPPLLLTTSNSKFHIPQSVSILGCCHSPEQLITLIAVWVCVCTLDGQLAGSDEYSRCQIPLGSLSSG